jgi:hypothetical protein
MQAGAASCHGGIDGQGATGKLGDNMVFEPCTKHGSLSLVPPLETQDADFQLHDGDHGKITACRVNSRHSLDNIGVSLAVADFMQFGNHIGVEQVHQKSTVRLWMVRRAGSKSISDRFGMDKASTRLRRFPVSRW